MNMSKCRVFSLLFFFYNCTFFSIQIPIPQNDGETTYAIKMIDYEEVALQNLKITTSAPGCTINWREAFVKLAPFAINSYNRAKVNEDLAKKNEDQAKKNEDQAKRNSFDAARYHFILLSRNKFVFDEDHYCVGLPKDDNEFREQIKKDERFKDVPDAMISCKLHAKKWLWMLVKGDARIFTSLDVIRKRLDNNAHRFLWFVTQIQSIFDVFNDDIHSAASSLLDPKHVDINNIGLYMSFLNPDVQNAMKVFYESEGLKVDLNQKST